MQTTFFYHVFIVLDLVYLAFDQLFFAWVLSVKPCFRHCRCNSEQTLKTCPYRVYILEGEDKRHKLSRVHSVLEGDKYYGVKKQRS